MPFLSRPPRIKAITEKWNQALGLDENTVLHGLICIKHFEDQDLKKCGDKIQLLPHSIPSIFNLNVQNEKTEIDSNIDEGCEADSFFEELRQINSSECNELNSELEQEITANCQSCKSKDNLIIKYETEIFKLRKALKKVQNKVYYLETTKAKFNESMKKLKEQNLLDKALYSALQVRCLILNFRIKTPVLIFIFHSGIKKR